MTSSEQEKLANSLARLGANPELRSRVMELCREAETLLAAPGRSVRDDVTGPILDALHRDVGILRKKLSSGLVFDFHYRSKIAREFVMSVPHAPSHVWEPQTTKLLILLAKHAQHVLVGGAYFGDQAVLVAKEIAGRGGIVHGFELNDDQASMLEHNAALNGLSNIRVNRKGLWSDDATHLALVGEDSFAFPSEHSGTGRKPNTVTIDGYASQAGIPNIGLIMLDIEGGEHKALQGARAQLSLPANRAPNVVFEVHRHYVDWSNGLHETPIVKMMRDLGYAVYSVRDFQENRDMGNKPIELIAPETTYLDGPPHGFNMLAIKDKAVIHNSAFRLCDGVSPKLLVHKDARLHHPLDGL